MILRTSILFGGRVASKKSIPRVGRHTAAKSAPAVAAAKKRVTSAKVQQRQRENAAEKLFLRRIQEARAQRQRIIKAALRRALAGKSESEIKVLQLYEANKERAVAELERLKNVPKVSTASLNATSEKLTPGSPRQRCSSKTPRRERRVESAAEISARKNDEREAERHFKEMVASLKAQRKTELIAAREVEALNAARAEMEKAESAKAEKAKAEMAKAELAKAEKAKAELLKAERAKAERAKAERAKAERAKAESAVKITARKSDEQEAERHFKEMVASLKAQRKAELIAAQKAEEPIAAQTEMTKAESAEAESVKAEMATTEMATAESAKTEMAKAEPAVKITARRKDEREAERHFKEMVAGLKAQRKAELIAAQKARASNAARAETAKAESSAEITMHENAEQDAEQHFKEVGAGLEAQLKSQSLAVQKSLNSASTPTKIVDEETSLVTSEGDTLSAVAEVDSTPIMEKEKKEGKSKELRSVRRPEKAAARIRRIAASVTESARNAPVLDVPHETVPTMAPVKVKSTPTPVQKVPYMAPGRTVISDAYHQSAMDQPALHALPLAGFNEPPLVSQFRGPNEMTHHWRSMAWPTSVDAPVVSLHPQMMQAHRSPLGHVQAVPSAFPRGAPIPRQNRERQDRSSGLFRL